MDPPPTQRVSGWEDGVNLYDITVTGQSRHTVAVFPKCLLAKSSSFRCFFFLLCQLKWNNVNLQIKHFGKHNTERITWCWKQEVNQPISFSFTSVDPPLSLLVGRVFYTSNTEADTWTSQTWNHHRMELCWRVKNQQSNMYLNITANRKCF